MTVDEGIEFLGTVVDAVGVGIIVVGSLIALVRYFLDVVRRQDQRTRYSSVRQDVGKSILLGLEFLIGGDIIRTVVSPTLDGVTVLGIIVLIRTFLSLTLVLELEGRWPWQLADGPASAAGSGDARD